MQLIIKGSNQEFIPYKQDTITSIGFLGEYDYILPQSNQKVIQTSQVVKLNGSDFILEAVNLLDVSREPLNLVKVDKLEFK